MIAPRAAARRIDSVAFFEALASTMNAHPERFAAFGPADLVFAVIMEEPETVFRVGIGFEGVACTEVRAIDGAEARAADFRLAGTRPAWQEMFEDIAAHGRATGPFTINSLALIGERIRCEGEDPMGLDKFSRFNQTLQEYFDGAAAVLVGEALGSRP